MNVRKILVATDFSESSESALLQASTLARASDAELLIVHVDDSARFTDTGYAGWPINAPGENSGEELEKVVPSDPTIRFSRHMLSGMPAEEIVEFAESHDVDLIVLGTHGRTGIKRLLLGSVAEKLVRNSKCPVLTVGQGCKAETTSG